MALGARRGQIRNQFLFLALRLLAYGVMLGGIGAWLAGQAMQTVLFHVPAFNLAILSSAAGIMGLLSIVTCLLPLCRAARTSRSKLSVTCSESFIRPRSSRNRPLLSCVTESFPLVTQGLWQILMEPLCSSTSGDSPALCDRFFRGRDSIVEQGESPFLRPSSFKLSFRYQPLKRHTPTGSHFNHHCPGSRIVRKQWLDGE
jgi:hypothetical protein